MKNNLLAFLFLVVASCIASAQTNKEGIEIANGICDCFTKHNPVKDKKFYKIVDKIYKMSPSEAEAYIQKMPQDQQTLFEENLDKIEALDQSNPIFKSCLDSWETKAKAYDDQQRAAGKTMEDTIQEMRVVFNKKKQCHILSLLMGR